MSCVLDAIIVPDSSSIVLLVTAPSSGWQYQFFQPTTWATASKSCGGEDLVIRAVSAFRDLRYVRLPRRSPSPPSPLRAKPRCLHSHRPSSRGGTRHFTSGNKLLAWGPLALSVSKSQPLSSVAATVSKTNIATFFVDFLKHNSIT